jgi:RHS repeat-associated protein
MMQGVNKREREVYLFALLRKDFASKRSAVTSHGVTNVVDTVYDAGMPMEEVDSSGNITAARKYDVYGLVRSGQVGSSSQKYVGSLGHESEGNTGLIYMRARYMDPVLGRFISEDPSRDGANWFVYCDSNSINLQDRSGKDAATNWLTVGWMLAIASWIVAVYGFLWGAANIELPEDSEPEVSDPLIVEMPIQAVNAVQILALLAVAAFNVAFLGLPSSMGWKAIQLDVVSGLVNIFVSSAEKYGITLTILGPASVAVGSAYVYGLATIGALAACDDAFMEGV